MEGKLTVRRFNGFEVYPITGATMMPYLSNGTTLLNLEVECDGEPIEMTTDDTGAEDPRPGCEITLDLSGLGLDDIVGRTFSLESGESQDGQDLVSGFYYFEHQLLNDNVVHFATRDASGQFHVRWTAKTMDPNYYDGSKPDALVEIDALFSLFSRSSQTKLSE
jgi:hypothetical protein